MSWEIEEVLFDQVRDRKHYLAVTYRLLSSCVKRFSLIDRLEIYSVHVETSPRTYHTTVLKVLGVTSL